MNYPEELRERYNEVMYDERDIIEKFLEDQYDMRYGHQRDTWHFEPAIEMMAYQGSTVELTDIRLDKNCCVKFIVDAYLEKGAVWECIDFAYGELSKVIEALPDVGDIRVKNARNDIAEMCNECSINLEDNPFKAFVKGEALSIYGVHYDNGHIRAYTYTGKDVMDETNTGLVLGLRNHLNICILHRYSEYKKLVKFLSEQPNLYFEPADFGYVEFTIHGTDVKVDVLSASLDSNENLQICCNDGRENIYLDEKDIRPEYLVNLVDYIEDHCWSNIMDGYNGHDIILVNKINKAWKNEQYHDLFGGILLALLYRDHEEYIEKYGEIDDYSEEYAMARAHHILENMCDDQDLETILSFIRYE